LSAYEPSSNTVVGVGELVEQLWSTTERPPAIELQDLLARIHEEELTERGFHRAFAPTEHGVLHLAQDSSLKLADYSGDSDVSLAAGVWSFKVSPSGGHAVYVAEAHSSGISSYGDLYGIDLASKTTTFRG